MKASSLIALALAAATAVSLAVANQANVTFKLVPFVADDSAFTLVTPLYRLVFFMFWKRVANRKLSRLLFKPLPSI